MIKLLETLQWRAHRTSAMEIHWKLTETHRKVHTENSVESAEYPIESTDSVPKEETNSNYGDRI